MARSFDHARKILAQNIRALSGMRDSCRKKNWRFVLTLIGPVSARSSVRSAIRPYWSRAS